jgi:hypothetical protein
MLQQTEELQECCSKQKNYRNAATNRRIQECCNKQKNYRNAAAILLLWLLEENTGPIDEFLVWK